MAHLGPGALIWQLPEQQALTSGPARAPPLPRLLLHALHALRPALAPLVGCSLPDQIPQYVLLLSFLAPSLLNMLPCLRHAFPSHQPAHHRPVFAFQSLVLLWGRPPQKSLSS